jgi:hypothetical protein
MKLKGIPSIGLTLAAGLVALTLSPIAAQAASASSARNGQIHFTKDCSTYFGAAGDHCTIITSDFDLIAAGSRISYDQAAGKPADLLDSNVVLDAGTGNRAVGRCTLDLGTGHGLCTFSDGTGSLIGFQARLDVVCPGPVCSVDGTFRFAPQPDR